LGCGWIRDREAARERFRALADQVESAYAEIRCLSSDEVGNEFRVEMAEHLATQERSNRGLMYRVFGEIADPPDQTGMVPAVVNSLAGRLRIAPREVKRRMKVAARIRPRTERPAAATATAPCGRRGAGREDREDHLRVISWAMRWSAAWCARRPRTMPTSFRPRPGVSMRSSTPTGISTKKTGPAAAA
jgi:Domain of unknown function (DUF222)